MAKKPSNKSNANVNIEILKQIAASADTFFISKDDGLPLLNANPPLIEVNVEMVDANNNAAARLTEAGMALVAAATKTTTAAPTNDAKPSGFAIIKGAVLPPSKRGGRGGGAPIKYPFADLDVGDTFFVPVSVERPDPVKTLGSVVSSANMRYATETGETHTVERAVRDGRKAKLDENGNKIMEKKEVPVYKFERKFTIRGVEKGVKYGEWVAPGDGALIARVS